MAPRGRDTATSPTCSRGSIEPLLTVVGCHPMIAGNAPHRPRQITMARTAFDRVMAISQGQVQGRTSVTV